MFHLRDAGSVRLIRRLPGPGRVHIEILPVPGRPRLDHLPGNHINNPLQRLRIPQIHQPAAQQPVRMLLGQFTPAVGDLRLEPDQQFLVMLLQKIRQRFHAFRKQPLVRPPVAALRSPHPVKNRGILLHLGTSIPPRINPEHLIFKPFIDGFLRSSDLLLARHLPPIQITNRHF
ncbi:MAG: hypothetical protein BWY71_01951 [Planctomycetes bacterium ADurb.Bin412]|nr:MAG: hypothetical protein BWY71_01951 [Planctomycetes bacterium ADurb.Bin412]